MMKVRRSYPEQQVQRDIMALAEQVGLRRHCVFCAIPNESKDRIRNAILQSIGLQPGAADLVYVWHGGSAFHEVKSKSGAQSPNQKAFQQWCDEQRVPYRVIRSPAEAMEDWVRWGLISATMT